MESPYQYRIDSLRQDWSRPWRTVGFAIATFCLMHWWLSQPTGPFICDPIPGSRFSTRVNIAGLYWTADLDAAHATARKLERRVLIAFHGVSDTNAVLNERVIFVDSQVRRPMSQYILVMLHTDFPPDHIYRHPVTQEVRDQDADRFMHFESKHFKTIETPMYVVVEPMVNGEFRRVARFAQARIVNKEAFVAFLSNPKPGIVANTWKAFWSLWK